MRHSGETEVKTRAERAPLNYWLCVEVKVPVPTPFLKSVTLKCEVGSN